MITQSSILYAKETIISESKRRKWVSNHFFEHMCLFMKGHMAVLQTQHFTKVCGFCVCIPQLLQGFPACPLSSCPGPLPCCFMRLSKEFFTPASSQCAIPTTVSLFGSHTQSSSKPVTEAGSQAVSYPF